MTVRLKTLKSGKSINGIMSMAKPIGRKTESVLRKRGKLASVYEAAPKKFSETRKSFSS